MTHSFGMHRGGFAPITHPSPSCFCSLGALPWEASNNQLLDISLAHLFNYLQEWVLTSTSHREALKD